jgi:hypothetical protein
MFPEEQIHFQSSLPLEQIDLYFGNYSFPSVTDRNQYEQQKLIAGNIKTQ